jgi:hypothetical protein
MQQNPVLTVFVIITALAFVAQAGILFGIYRALVGSRRDFEAFRSELKSRFEPLVQTLTQIVTTSREPLGNLTSNLAEISRILRQRADHVDSVVAELTDRSRLQILRIDQMVTEFVQKAQSTAGVVERSILAPVSEVSALVKGIRAGLDFLVGRRRSSRMGEVTQDEQMFI